MRFPNRKSFIKKETSTGYLYFSTQLEVSYLIIFLKIYV
ncbi:hypothetical protein B4064_2569 [Caldibacillus thermoamylovorans]|uniref:Uncharacterized protein n=1 Tax=Caldibacillus thermoamylovorans TaxID=35841 RepID=A0A0D0FCN7_9BACI|nr:hypothetical protein B4065_0938 [Caldibacillus thermoamylovorans]KIO65508.1 hypothetical protein B4064_2569 [Caldibacillus thermoamylovorans]KIO70836.1 hypothetical protein B4166_1461 [Caldibacillus thermoamylovorans]KIO74242.1 hypothetical protein B4167_1527 [Caldibacillus thermoamylovorans]